MTLTVTHTSPIASVGTSAAQSGNAVSGQNQSDVFGSLLATLFGLSDQTSANNPLAAALEGKGMPSPALTDQAPAMDELLGADGKPLMDLAGLDIAALMGLAQAQLQAQANPDTDGQNVGAGTAEIKNIDPQQLVAALVKALQGLEGAVNTAQLTDAGKAADALTKLLASATGTAPNADPALNGAPALGAEVKAQVDALTKLAEKFTVQAPELSAKLAQLADKLQQLSQPAATTAVTDADLQQTLQALVGEKQVTGKEANTPLTNTQPTGAAKGLDQSASPANSPLDAAKLDLNAAKTLNGATPQPTPAATSASETTFASAAAAANAATPPAKSGTAPQTDALLLAQSNNQLGIKTDIAAAVKPMTAAYQTPTQNLNLPHIAFEIARNHQDGMSRFQIRLDPPEMGRIDVKLNVDGAGNLHARMTVDRPDTLDLLQRDARSLERALQQAGIDGGRTNLEFSLRQNPFARQDGQPQGGQQNNGSFALDEVETKTTDVPAAIYYRGTASPGGVNMLA